MAKKFIKHFENIHEKCTDNILRLGKAAFTIFNFESFWYRDYVLKLKNCAFVWNISPVNQYLRKADWFIKQKKNQHLVVISIYVCKCNPSKSGGCGGGGGRVCGGNDVCLRIPFMPFS